MLCKTDSPERCISKLCYEAPDSFCRHGLYFFFPINLTFALRGILGAIAKDVDLVHGSKGLKELFEFRFRPGPRDLSHKHLDGVRVGLVQVFQRPGHLDAVAIAAGQKEKEMKWSH